MPIKKGSTDRSVDLHIIDAANGTNEDGVTYATAGLALWYCREGGTKQAITAVTKASHDAAHVDGGFLLISDGDYRLDVPDAAWATGSSRVRIGGIVTGMIIIPVEIELVNYEVDDLESRLTATRAGYLDNLAGLTAARMGALTDWIDGGRLDLILDAINAAAARLTVARAGYIDLINTNLDAAISTRLATSGYTAPANSDIETILARLGAPSGASIAADIASRLAAAGYSAPDNATIAAIAGYLDTEIATVLAAVDTEVATAVTQATEANAHAHAIDARLPADPTDASELAALLSAISAAISTRAAPGDAMVLTSGERTELGAALGARQVGDVAAATQDKMTRAILAALASITAGGGTGLITGRNLANNADLFQVTVDENDNRTAVTIAWANA